jgi:hypothetical protein
MTDSWVPCAVEAVDAANAEDPRVVDVGGAKRPFELFYADRLQHWLGLLMPDPSGALAFAARAQHVRRWQIPRTDFADGRAGYQAWKRRLEEHHVATALGILSRCGCDQPSAERVESILRKRGRETNPEVQAMQDALGLVTLELQLDELAAKLDTGKLTLVLRRTLAKMSPRAHQLAGRVPVAGKGREALALATSSSSVPSSGTERGGA